MTGSDHYEYGKTYILDSSNHVVRVALSPNLVPRYSYVYIKGDYDERSLPGVNDLDASDSLYEVQRELKMVARENDIPENHYVLVKSYATPWEVVNE